MVCPKCKTLAGIDSNRIVGETETAYIHKITYICRNPRCQVYLLECGSREYEEPKDDTPEEG